MARTIESTILSLVCGVMLLLTLLLTLLLNTPNVEAQGNLGHGAPPESSTRVSPLSGACYGLDIETVYTPLLGGRFDIKVKTSGITVVVFPDWVDFDFGAYGHDGFKITPYGNLITVSPQGASVDTKTNVVLTAGDFATNMNITMSDTEHTDVLRVKPLTLEELERRKRTERAAAEQQTREHDAVSRHADHRENARFLLNLQELRAGEQRVALAQPDVPAAGTLARPGEIRAVLSWAVQLDDQYYGLVLIDNQTDEHIDVLEAAITRQGERSGETTEVFWEESAPMEGATLKLGDKQTVRGIVVIPKDLGGPELIESTTSIDAVEVHFVGRGNITVASTTRRIIQLYPLPEHELRRRRMSTQTTVSMRALFGGFWTTAGDDLGGLDGTTVAGLGARIQKGYRNGFAMEGELVLSGTGDARFDGMSWDGMTGDITRRATLGRAMGGAAMRFGTDYVFTGRMGVGMQVASYDSTFAMGGPPMTGPGDGLEVDGVWSVGGGFDARLGTHWALGAAATFAGTFYTGSRSFEAGLHLGYGWN